MIDSTQTPVDIEPERYELFEGPRFRFAVDRRGFLKSLGGGILVLHLLNNANAEQQPRGRRGGRGGGQTAPREIAAWLHINEDGRVAVYTGKAEVGQNIRTSLTQVVAEELHTAPASIHLVMADTHLTPFDAGTFGSRTTPDMSQRLRRTAAAAREMLIDLAAESWKAERAKLKAEGGNIVHSGTGQKVEFGKLTKGQKLTKTVADDTAPTPPESWTIAGHSEPKVDGRSFVTGQHQYTSDLKLPGMLYGKVLRPPSFGATLASVDLTGAKSLPGVVVVRDGDFIGVTAPNSSLATRALAAIKAEWKPGPSLSAKDLFDSLKSQGREARGERGGAARSVGSIANGSNSTGIHLEQTYTIAYIAHAPLEPRAAVALWDNGKLTVWTGSQRPFGVANELTNAFGLASGAVRVIVPDTGAGYGGKHSGEAAVEAARLAKTAGKPVKLVWTREEEFTWAYFRPAGVVEVKSSARRDGTLTAWEFHNYNSGSRQSDRHTTSRVRSPSFTAFLHRFARALTERLPPRPITLPASRTWTSSHTPPESIRSYSASITSRTSGSAPSSRPPPRPLVGARRASPDMASESRPDPIRADTSQHVRRWPSSLQLAAFRSSVRSVHSNAARSSIPTTSRTRSKAPWSWESAALSSKRSSMRMAGSPTRVSLAIACRGFAILLRSTSCCSTARICRQRERAKRRSLPSRLQLATQFFSATGVRLCSLPMAPKGVKMPGQPA